MHHLPNRLYNLMCNRQCNHQPSHRVIHLYSLPCSRLANRLLFQLPFLYAFLVAYLQVCLQLIFPLVVHPYFLRAFLLFIHQFAHHSNPLLRPLITLPHNLLDFQLYFLLAGRQMILSFDLLHYRYQYRHGNLWTNLHHNHWRIRLLNHLCSPHQSRHCTLKTIHLCFHRSNLSFYRVVSLACALVKTLAINRPLLQVLQQGSLQ